MPAKKAKTTETDAAVFDFLEAVPDMQKRNDSWKLVELMQSATGFPPKMWGPSIVGFGKYHYVYPSGHSGDAPLIGFSPRKPAFSLYIFSGTQKQRKLLASFGKFTMGKSCIYVKRLMDIDEKVMLEIINDSVQHTLSIYPNT